MELLKKVYQVGKIIMGGPSRPTEQHEEIDLGVLEPILTGIMWIPVIFVAYALFTF